MIRRTLQGLAFDMPSPSHLELVLPRPHLDRVSISYLGDPHQWFLFHQDPAGNVGTKQFACRDDAVAMIAQAFSNAGAI